MQFIDLKAQYRRLQDEIDARMKAVLEHGMYVMGPEVRELESELAAFTGVKHAVSCANGTDAIQLALMVSGVGPGDAVFVPTFTFSATAEPVAMLGATPVFVDIDAETFNMSMQSLKDAYDAVVSEGRLRPVAVIPVDLFGVAANYDEIEPFCAGNNLVMIEDAAQSFGASLSGRRCGSFGALATTSFFPAKPLGCYGDGGCVFTDDDDLDEHLRSLRVHGQGKDKYENLHVGINSRLDTLQAAVLQAKMGCFEEELVLREQVRRRYDELLGDYFELQHVGSAHSSAVAQYALMGKAGIRDDYLDALKAASIPTAIYYPVPLHKAPAYRDNTLAPVPCPVAESAADRVFSIPMHPYLKEEDLQRIATTLINACPAQATA